MRRLMLALVYLASSCQAMPAIAQCPNGRCPLVPAQLPAPDEPRAWIVDLPREQPAQSSVRLKPRPEWTMADCVGRVLAPIGPGRASSGSGPCVYAQDGLVLALTCHHVIDGNRGQGGLTITFHDGRRYGCTLVAADERADLALLKLDCTDIIPHVPIADQAPGQGESLWKIGFPGGRGPSEGQGTMLGFAGRRLKGSIYVTHGDSGGSITTRAGELVGIVSSYNAGDPNRYVNGVSTADINSFMTEVCWPRLRRQAPCPPTGPCPAPSRPTPGPAPAPAPSPVPAPGQAAADLGQLLKKLDELNGKIEELAKRPSTPGPKGDQGEPGAKGERGPAGPQGPPGKDADTSRLEADIKALKEQLSQLSGTLRVTITPQKK